MNVFQDFKMSHGGPRQGAGRKPGQANRINQEAREAAVASGETPLEYMLKVMRDQEAELPRRDDMAKAAAPYVHAKLTSVDASVQANVDGTITFTWLPSS